MPIKNIYSKKLVKVYDFNDSIVQISSVTQAKNLLKQ